MDFGELIQRQISQGKEILTKIEALQAIPVPKNDFGDGMAVIGVPRQQPKYDETQISSIKSEMRKWQSVSLEVLRNGLPTNALFISQFQETVTDKHYVYNIKTSMKREVTNGVDVLESVSESLELNLVNGEANPIEKKSKVKVFISHASKDWSFIQPFKDIILKQALGLKDENIVCTSFESTGVPPGENIPQYIKENIGNASVFLAMVSNNYKASEVCMNEVGAAWALGKKPIQVVLPGVEFDKLGWLIKLDKAAKIDDGDSLDNLAEVISNGLGQPMVTPVHWNQPKAAFLEAIAVVTDAVAASEQPCCICFQGGTQETTIHPKLVATTYYAPRSKVQPQNDEVPVANSLLALSSSLNYIAAQYQSIQQAQFEIAKPKSRETNLAICPMEIYFSNNGDALAHTQVEITADDGVRFCEYNYKDLGMGALNLIAHSQNYSIDDESYWCNIGDVNAQSSRNLPLFYFELPSLYKQYDSFTSYDDCYPKQVVLPYSISTKHKRFNGSLVIKIEPEFEEEWRESKTLAGKIEIHPKLETIE